MTYLQFHFVFILPVIAALIWLFKRRLGTASFTPYMKWLGVISGIALVYTTLWDNYLVFKGIWYYGADRVIGTIGYVPVEEYLFFLFQPILTGLTLYVLLLKHKPLKVADASNKPRWIGVSVYVLLIIAGVLHFRQEAGLYMALILVWACPVLAGQWAYAGNWIWAERRLWFLSTLLPTVYLWIADRIALALGIWFIAEEYTTGWLLFGLPIEEATFFLVTNLLVVQGLFLFLHIGDPEARESYLE